MREDFGLDGFHIPMIVERSSEIVKNHIFLAVCQENKYHLKKTG